MALAFMTILLCKVLWMMQTLDILGTFSLGANKVVYFHIWEAGGKKGLAPGDLTELLIPYVPVSNLRSSDIALLDAPKKASLTWYIYIYSLYTILFFFFLCLLPVLYLSV